MSAPRMIRWRLYGLPDGRTTARPVTRPASADPDMSIATIEGRAVIVTRPLPLSRDAVVLVEYRDAPDAMRSARWSAALDWAIRAYGL